MNGGIIAERVVKRHHRKALVACCKRLGVWTKGKAVAQMEEALGGAFALALAQHREAQQRGAAGAAALERLAAAAPAVGAHARAPAQTTQPTLTHSQHTCHGWAI